ncbi:MAG: ABC transporter permease [Deinococcus sp.]|nr:ABC transporter permease [Deinococcus sp.]
MRIARYATRRLALLVPVLLGATLVAFLLTRIVPGNPIDKVAGPYVSVERRAQMKHEARLDLPIAQQFVLYVADVVTKGDLGVSYTTGQPVLNDLLQRFPATFELVTFGMVLAILIAVPLGAVSALRKDSLGDQVGRVLAVLGVSIPIFWLGLLLLYLFFFRLSWAPPPLGRLPPLTTSPPHVTGLFTVDALLAGQWQTLGQALAALILPAVTLAVTAMAPITRITRSSMIEALESEFVRASTSLGLPWRTIVWRHAFRNALIPVLTMIAAVYGFALGGEVIVEYVFSWPGLGNYALNAILGSDFPAIQGMILLVTTSYLVIYLLLDLSTAAIDPRVELT